MLCLIADQIQVETHSASAQEYFYFTRRVLKKIFFEPQWGALPSGGRSDQLTPGASKPGPQRAAAQRVVGGPVGAAPGSL